ncbi:HAMP domain-containing sensor histidine kinase [Streptomyces griseoaurantiacus]|uniref:sensor histidine kinase n=1 Tax=Streptomyces TaxID=1883 RepID=UPI0029B87EE2|nr:MULTISPECIES: HAMP domain-containing sensor histidine kinase [unclassified Streptomyces]MDX3088551.1 HAMP domain-containing sensor histidine kinase [Streptomyces sp. ME12-02E]MDX3331920.1 HAMP domain-containing sensor histidine kinase [Streptomyces sp. ME02-6978a]
MRRRLLTSGLRTRLVVTFVLVAALSALTTAALTFQQARTAILARAQDNAVRDLRAQVASLAPDLPARPTEADLRGLALQLDRAGGARDWRVAAAYRHGTPVSARSPGPGLPAGLEDRAARATTALVQRYHRDGRPRLAVALPVVPADHPGRPSGLVVYATFSLTAQEQDVTSLVRAARAGALPVVLASLIPALLAARRVLRPVRRLRSAAESMATGDLDTRIEVTGHDELADLGGAFNTMAATLQEDAATLRAMEARARRFAADVSHELRTPLAAMTAVTGLLDDDAAAGHLGPETSEAITLVADETRKLAHLVEDLMEISRFDAGAARLDLDEIDLGELLHKTLALRHWQDRVTVDVPGGLRARLDPRRIDVVLANLTGNALRHGGPGARVRIRARTEAERLVLTVHDNGPGIAEDMLPHVFDRFTKGDTARTRSEGSGLGLAIAAENARLHGGTLAAANSPEGGAVFTLTLPREPA